MAFFNDPTSCNDLKLTLVLIAILVTGSFYWLLERGNKAIEQNNNTQNTTTTLKQHIQSLSESLNHHQQNVRQLTTTLATARQKNTSLQQQQQILITEKQQLVQQIETLKQHYQAQQHSIIQATKTNEGLTIQIEQNQQDLNQSRQLSQAQINEYEHLKQQFKQLQKEAEQRLNALKKWQQEVVMLKQQLADTQIKIIESQQRFTVFEMKQDILFDKGETRLNIEGQQALAHLADILHQYPNRQIAIQGHSDAQALGKKLKQKYVSNWGLSAARAASAIHYLQYKENIKPERIMLVSYAHYRPKMLKQTPADFAANRRIEITLMPENLDFFKQQNIQ